MDGGTGGKLIALATGVVAGAGAVEQAGRGVSETAVLNVPLSMLYIAIAGTLIGVFLLPARDAARLSMHGSGGWRARLLFLLTSAGFLGAVVISYAFIAAWLVQLAAEFFQLREAVALPFTGLVGVGVRPWLPVLLKAFERRADRIIGGDPP